MIARNQTVRHFGPAAITLAVASCWALLGCRSVPDALPARELFYRGAIEESRQAILQHREEDRSAELVADLDLAVISLAQGDAKAAEKQLLHARQQLDENQSADIVEGTLSYVSDDTVRSYRGSGYEQVMIRAMLAMTSLMHDAIDAEAYALQAIEKQKDNERRAEEAGFWESGTHHVPLALAPYLRGMLRESHHQDFDDATRAYQLVSEIRPTFAPASFDLARAQSGVHSAPGNGVLYVFAMVGRGPIRTPQVSEVTSDTLLAVDRIVSALGKYSVPPTMAPIEIPAVTVPHCPVDTVHVIAGREPLGLTQSLTDVGQLAHSQFYLEKKELLIRAVARRVVKKSAVAAGKDALDIEDPMMQLIVDLAGSFWEATEKPDLRCWSLLPREIQVLRAELPSGEHMIGLQSFGTGSPLHLDPLQQKVEIADGRNTYIIAFAPHDRVVASTAKW